MMIKQITVPFIRTQKKKQLLMKVILTMYLNQSTLLLYQKYKYLSEKVWVVSLIQLQITILVFKIKPGSKYVKLPKKLDHPKEGLVNIQNINNNECFKWYLVR